MRWQESSQPTREPVSMPEHWQQSYGGAVVITSQTASAEVLLEQYPDERPEAMEHLDFAIGEFRDMKMQPSLERALRHRKILRA